MTAGSPHCEQPAAFVSSVVAMSPASGMPIMDRASAHHIALPQATRLTIARYLGAALAEAWRRQRDPDRDVQHAGNEGGAPPQSTVLSYSEGSR